MSATNVNASVQGSTSRFAGKKVWITGHRGMLGSAVVRNFKGEGAQLLLTSRADLDLTNQAAVYDWMDKNRPDFVFHVGAKVGGIHANSTLPASFIYDNLMIQTNVISGHTSSALPSYFSWPLTAPIQKMQRNRLLNPPYSRARWMKVFALMR